ncbi:MAG: amino acid carrier protein [Planctomycetota bacterium]|nr:amino acid carrier protein [Planctomycetota bacterium]
MDHFMDFIEQLGAWIWSTPTFVGLLGAGVLFTLWTRFTQYRVMTHGLAIVRGIYDDPDDPGAINHFQALSAALSATVGLGNIGGVAVAISVGGPGALFWMWVVGFFGMALKTVEITLAMIYRDTTDPDNPSGGAMHVVKQVLAKKGRGWAMVGSIIGGFFCVTLIISTITGGNMFQAWNVAGLTEGYFGVPKVATGIILAMTVGLVIIGGIKRIGTVAGKLVPLMCLLYLVSGFAVLVVNADQIPEMLMLVFRSAFGTAEAEGAFLGGTLGYAFIVGMKRALFSNEAGQGSAPIAHAAAKTGEPAREGIVGGLGPFIDTICICTLTAMVILSTGTWNREAIGPIGSEVSLKPVMQISDGAVAEEEATHPFLYTFDTSAHVSDLPQQRLDQWSKGDKFFLIAEVAGLANANTGGSRVKIQGKIVEQKNEQNPDAASTLFIEWKLSDLYSLAVGEMTGGPFLEGEKVTRKTGKAARVAKGISSGDNNLFLTGFPDEPFAEGEVLLGEESDASCTVRGAPQSHFELEESVWSGLLGDLIPLQMPDGGAAVYREYEGAHLTAFAFDRVFPGLGKWLVTLAAWLFAISTMISWSYYGEKGIAFMFGARGILPYKIAFLLLAIVGAAMIEDTAQMMLLADLGTGSMLVVNIPIVLALGGIAVASLREYDRKLKAGEFTRHDGK